jgi:hypothetical protein
LIEGAPSVIVWNEIDRIEDEAALPAGNNPPASTAGSVIESRSSGDRGELYANGYYDFSFRWPEGWLDVPGTIREAGVYVELNRSKIAGGGIPGMCVMVNSLVCREKCDSQDLRAVMDSARGALEKRSTGAEFSVVEDLHEITVSHYPAIRTVKRYNSLPSPTGGEPIRDIKMFYYAFPLKGRQAMLSISFYVHNDNRLSEELREMEAVLRSLTLISEEPKT